MIHRIRSVAWAAILLIFGLWAAPSLAAQPAQEDGDSSAVVGRAEPWPADIVDMASRLPVLEHGRIKPLSTLAGFALLRMHHTRKVKDATGERLSPTEWLLDAFFYPEISRSYMVFRVQTHEVLQAIGVSTEGKKKRDLYSYNELEPARDRLMALASSYSTIDPKERTSIQGQVLNLANNLQALERFLHYMDFTRTELGVQGVLPFAAEEGQDDTRSVSQVIEAGPDVAMAQANGDQVSPADTARMIEDLFELAERSSSMLLIPPAVDAEERPEWTSPGDLMAAAFLVGAVDERHLAMLAACEGMAEARSRPDDFRVHLTAFAERSRELAATRGEAGKVDLEVTYYKMDFFYRSVVLYVLAFLMVAVTWVRRGMRKLFGAALAVTALGAGLHVAGIVVRCILRSRPPISTLYETVVFVAATAVLVSLFIERVDRRRMAGAVAPFLGALGLFIAMRFEELKGEDTMPQLQAVLDTNFWLSIHVTCITMGYSAALLASAFAHVFVLGKVFGFRKDDRAMYRGLGNTVYGTLCFALVLSVIGTILGGIWANDSWGRFWGWDPKENGALMIVLAQLTLLHARMGGYIKAFGIAIAVIAQGAVVAFSWWGVNLLGVGLHSYGFTDGINSALNLFYGIEGAVVVVGGGWWLHQRYQAKKLA
ncbi:MAG: ABC-type transport system involved in cytochrome c biogenesis permease subunit [Chlamydiales bacterium]